MSHLQCNESIFLNDVANHEMTIIRDDGLYRHVRFGQSGSSEMQFDLLTWPGYLCYTGDMGTYVFHRLRDMFEFFRTDRKHMRPCDGQTLAINLSYWSEKLEAVNRSGSSGSYEEFSEDKFHRAVLSYLVQWIRSNYDRTTKNERRDLWEAVIDQVIEAESDSGGYRKQHAAYDFHHAVNYDVGDFYFQDFWENDVTDYSFQFTWCCFALAWGIQQYDQAKIIPALASANFPCGSMGEEVTA